MGNHVEINEANKTEKCATCGQKFATTIQLHEHSKIHRVEDPQVAKFVERLGKEAEEEEGEEEEDEGADDGWEEMEAEEEEEKKKVVKKKRPTNHAADILKDKEAGKNQWVICSVCGKCVVSEKALSRHMETHNATREMTCEFCQKKFQTRKTLQGHRKIHFVGDKFKCDICNKVWFKKV